jgi:hypothetical protein
MSYILLPNTFLFSSNVLSILSILIVCLLFCIVQLLNLLCCHIYTHWHVPLLFIAFFLSVIFIFIFCALIINIFFVFSSLQVIVVRSYKIPLKNIIEKIRIEINNQKRSFSFFFYNSRGASFYILILVFFLILYFIHKILFFFYILVLN